jgi:hypothetical protein
MTVLTKEVKSFNCDSQAEVESTISTEVASHANEFRLDKKEVKFKQVKKKGEIVDEYYIVTLTFNLIDE